MIWLTTMFVVITIFVVPAIFALLLSVVPASEQPGYDDTVKLSIYGKRDIVQRFVSVRSNLTAIGTSIKNPNLSNKKDIIFNLYDENGKLLRATTINGRNIQDGEFIKIMFEPVFDSLNKTYTFSLSSPSAGSADEIEVFVTTPTSTVLSYTYDLITQSGGLPLVTFHKPTSRLATVKEVYSNLFSRFLLHRSQTI